MSGECVRFIHLLKDWVSLISVSSVSWLGGMTVCSYWIPFAARTWEADVFIKYVQCWAPDPVPGAPSLTSQDRGACYLRRAWGCPAAILWFCQPRQDNSPLCCMNNVTGATTFVLNQFSHSLYFPTQPFFLLCRSLTSLYGFWNQEDRAKRLFNEQSLYLLHSQQPVSALSFTVVKHWLKWSHLVHKLLV